MSLADTLTQYEAWHRDYNEGRPYSHIGNKPSITLQKRSEANGQPLLAVSWLAASTVAQKRGAAHQGFLI
jgi:hypothetical protein